MSNVSKIMVYKIYGAYQWKELDIEHSKKKNEYTLKAINSLISQVKTRIKDFPVSIRYNRLRATAGSFLLEGIRDVL